MNDFNKINDGDCSELCLGQQKNNIISIYKIKKVAMEKKCCTFKCRIIKVIIYIDIFFRLFPFCCKMILQTITTTTEPIMAVKEKK